MKNSKNLSTVKSIYSSGMYTSQQNMMNSGRSSTYKPLLNKNHNMAAREFNTYNSINNIASYSSNLVIKLKDDIASLNSALSKHREDKQLALKFNALLLEKIYALTEGRKI